MFRSESAGYSAASSRSLRIISRLPAALLPKPMPGSTTIRSALNTRRDCAVNPHSAETLQFRPRYQGKPCLSASPPGFRGYASEPDRLQIRQQPPAIRGSNVMALMSLTISAPACRAAAATRGFPGIDGEGHRYLPDKPFNNRHDPLQLFSCGNRRCIRPGALAADIDNISSVRNHLQRSGNSISNRTVAAAVRK